MNDAASGVVAYERPESAAVAARVPAGSPLLEVRDLKTWFPIRRGILSRTVGHVKAVDGVSFDIHAGKTLGLVGESGCGKTTVGRSILRLVPPTGGTVTYKGEDFFSFTGKRLRQVRRQMQIVFQDPVSSLNPRMTIGNIIGEPLEVHGIARGRAKQQMVAGLLQRVGLDPSYASRYPHEFSGGQRQRIGIARALALSPDFIVCDEPVSALDVSIQSQILNLLDDLQKERGIAYLFIAHNLAVVEHFSDEVAVMYLGRIVEKAASRELYSNPKHPYTVALLSAVPEPNPRPTKRRIVLPGEVPSPSNPPTGCPFHPRCLLTRQKAAESNASETVVLTYKGGSLPDAATTGGNGAQTARVMRKCVAELPPLEQKRGQDGHVAACWYSQ
ncbi:MAG TPA: oligopeptide/dipeptide ABC transporter ATP-binding protein [Tepidisphaeraceae bacterium]|nr:oligopeptide/dipeptide ABC transporter ATP-binding protein [Tepidisphaeraceae bacterium]